MNAASAGKRFFDLRRPGVPIGLSLLILTMATSPLAQVRDRSPYILVDLGGAPPGAYPQAISDDGRVAGNMGLYGFRTEPNQPIVPSTDSLGALPDHNRSFAHAIDSSGVVVGDSVNDYNYQWRAFRYGFNGGGMEDLHNMGIHSFARGLNDHNWVVGSFTTSSYRNQAMVSWGPGWTYSLEYWLSYPWQSEANDVNNLDQIVGWLSTPSSAQLGFLLDFNSGRVIRLGTVPQGTMSRAYGVNDLSHVVGEVGLNNWPWPHAFLWKDDNSNGVSDAGEMRLLTSDYPCGRASGINNAGTVVGSYCSNERTTYGQSRPFMLSANGKLVDLNTVISPGTGWLLREANGINNNGQIVGWMHDAAGRLHGYRLDPRPSVIVWP